MSNRTQLRERLRVELGDTGTNKVWSDTLLDDLLIDSVTWYSRLFPMRASGYRDVAQGQRTFSVPPGAFSIAQVECPPGTILPQEATGATGTPGSTGINGQRQSWSLWGDTIYLGNPASGGEVGATRLILRVLLPWDRLDPSDDWTGPEDDERLLVLWAATQAWEWLDGQDQKRGRPSKAGQMAARYQEQLEREVQARRRAATSRRLEVG
jgi:hypothetical protein